MEACEILARKSNGQANGFAGAGGWNIASGQPQGSNESNVPETPDLLWSKWENRNDLNRPDFFIENAASPNFGPFGPVNNLAFHSPNNAMGQPNRYQMGLPRGPYAMDRPMANPMMGTPNGSIGAPVNVFILNGGWQNGPNCLPNSPMGPPNGPMGPPNGPMGLPYGPMGPSYDPMDLQIGPPPTRINNFEEWHQWNNRMRPIRGGSTFFRPLGPYDRVHPGNIQRIPTIQNTAMVQAHPVHKMTLSQPKKNKKNRKRKKASSTS